MYDVSESVGSVDLGVVFISGNAEEFVPCVNVSTVDGTATSKYYINIVLSTCTNTTMRCTKLQFAASGGEADYDSVVDQSISFTSSNRDRDLTVQITPDNFTELSENFTAVLTSVFLSRTAGGVAIELTDQERVRLILNPDTATVNILDDDGK